MEARTTAARETPEQAADSIASALDFLEDEAKRAGLSDLGKLINRASSKAKEHRASEMAATDLPRVCKAIAGLPVDCRKALIFRKVYQRSYQEIADDCSVSVATAKEQVAEGFRLVRGSLEDRMVYRRGDPV